MVPHSTTTSSNARIACQRFTDPPQVYGDAPASMVPRNNDGSRCGWVRLDDSSDSSRTHLKPTLHALPHVFRLRQR